MSLIIDVHTHPILASWEAAYDRTGLPKVNGRPLDETMRLPVWNPQISLDAMDRNGIQAMMLSYPSSSRILSGTAGQELARAMNEEMAGIVRQHPARFGAFAALPLDSIDAALTEAAYALDNLKLDGIGLPSNVDGVYLGDERFEPLFAECNARKIPVFVHPLTPTFADQVNLPFRAPVLEYLFDSTRTLTSLVYSGMRSRYADFPLISTHAGGAMPYIAGRLSTVATTLGVGNGRTMDREEVMAGLRSFHFDVTSSTTATSLASLLQLVPSTRLMMGTDFPIRPEAYIPGSISQVEQSELLNDDQRKDIFSATALGLIPRLAAALREAKVDVDAAYRPRTSNPGKGA